MFCGKHHLLKFPFVVSTNFYRNKKHEQINNKFEFLQVEKFTHKTWYKQIKNE